MVSCKPSSGLSCPCTALVACSAGLGTAPCIPVVTTQSVVPCCPAPRTRDVAIPAGIASTCMLLARRTSSTAASRALRCSARWSCMLSRRARPALRLRARCRSTLRGAVLAACCVMLSERPLLANGRNLETSLTLRCMPLHLQVRLRAADTGAAADSAASMQCPPTISDASLLPTCDSMLPACDTHLTSLQSL